MAADLALALAATSALGPAADAIVSPAVETSGMASSSVPWDLNQWPDW